MKHWIKAFRPKTLLLSTSGILLAILLASSNGFTNIVVSILTLLTAICLQILSNLANDYGDGVKGTDKHRTDRLVQTQLISKEKMIRAMLLFSFLSLLFGTWVSYYVFQFTFYGILFVLLGICAVVAAIKYTVGKNSYGYYGMGDLFVFIFFGQLSVLGTYFLISKTLPWQIILPASSIGLFSVSVLNVNNLRDFETDRLAKKNTMVVRMGVKRAMVYQFVLLLSAFALALLYNLMFFSNWTQFLYFIILIPLAKHIYTVYNIKDIKYFDFELKKVALITFVFAITFGVGQIL
ncbi:1,4-dihydroxy-2-naphthoate octaprenyltransferase [Ichthyobacterium seriolicida]|uniref:1,4-dihydroxy-2-naphthoate octaprenyltransferase n=1 Tax=Ichthyobacterium seriolicida TaxID=242600 RepID=A0A1J1E2A8_9FLAO|nr:1,4-dihydroxy-2-naphthoate octaprenyltransferase [Ichthyobacterium seriolicida]BAV94172.1 1,4-dihydroxy-2-naphthoate octaprenyltransferase [Ichthyobacterium seriolicida]